MRNDFEEKNEVGLNPSRGSGGYLPACDILPKEALVAKGPLRQSHSSKKNTPACAGVKKAKLGQSVKPGEG